MKQFVVFASIILTGCLANPNVIDKKKAVNIMQTVHNNIESLKQMDNGSVTACDFQNGSLEISANKESNSNSYVGVTAKDRFSVNIVSSVINNKISFYEFIKMLTDLESASLDGRYKSVNSAKISEYQSISGHLFSGSPYLIFKSTYSVDRTGYFLGKSDIAAIKNCVAVAMSGLGLTDKVKIY